jgi:hypothetical protein
MNTNDNSKSKSRIKLSKTFFSKVAAKKRAEKNASKAEVLKRGNFLERTDPFISTFGR